MPKLTKRAIDRIRAPASGQIFLRDDELRGFAVRITRGAKSFILEKEINGRIRRMTLGRYGVLTVEQARKLAQEKIGHIGHIVRGGDPAEDRRGHLHSPTFQDLETMYLERHAAHKKSRKNDVSILNRHLAPWRPRKLSGLTRAEVARLHAQLGSAGHRTWANRVVALVRMMFHLAEEWGLHLGPNPAARIRMFQEVERARYLTSEELPRFFSALAQEPSPFIRAALLVALLTGARRTEVLTMQWDHLSLAEGLWRIPDTKAGRPHALPLAVPLVDLLRQLPRVADNPFVFPDRHQRGHLVNIDKAWSRIRRLAKVNDVRVHDLRRTLGSWLAGTGASLPLIGKVLNHSQTATTAIYARLDLIPVRKALEQNAHTMLDGMKSSRSILLPSSVAEDK
jgi:integrase